MLSVPIVQDSGGGEWGQGGRERVVYENADVWQPIWLLP